MDIKQELKNKNFQFKKKFGQNFLTDTNLLNAMVCDAQICEGDNVLEIGPGAGTLTKQICLKNPKKVVAVEVDKNLEPILKQNLSEFKNFELKMADILKVEPIEIKKWFSGEEFKVVANLPYYISTPIMFFLIENGFKLKSMTIMLQLELAQRLSAKPNTKDYGAITILLEFLGEVCLTRKVPRQLFTPQPNVDSAIVNFVLEKNKFDVSYDEFAKFVKACFSMRRKTLQNNLSKHYDIEKSKIVSALEKCKLNESIRAESLSCEKFVELFKTVFAK